MRQNPLPLRIIGAQPEQQQQQHSVVVNASGAAPPNPPGSPILTHLLHRKSPAPDPQVGIKTLMTLLISPNFSYYFISVN